jgi:hypothetical protein
LKVFDLSKRKYPGVEGSLRDLPWDLLLSITMVGRPLAVAWGRLDACPYTTELLNEEKGKKWLRKK